MHIWFSEKPCISDVCFLSRWIIEANYTCYMIQHQPDCKAPFHGMNGSNHFNMRSIKDWVFQSAWQLWNSLSLFILPVTSLISPGPAEDPTIQGILDALANLTGIVSQQVQHQSSRIALRWFCIVATALRYYTNMHNVNTKLWQSCHLITHTTQLHIYWLQMSV